MSEDPSTGGSATRSWLERLSQVFSGEPRNRDELIDELRAAQANGLMSQDALTMMEGAITVSDKTVGDVMVARAHMVTVPLGSPLDYVLRIVIESGHSRFPVLGQDRDEVVGILLAKDLLKCFAGDAPPCDISQLVRPVALIPESKRLNVLLREFRASRNHMAIVVDEYGGVCGLVTIEDVLEEIVGDIDDEHDVPEGVSPIQAQPDGRYLVNALTPIADFNARFGTQFEDDEFDTIGGLVTSQVGHLPVVGDERELSGLLFKVTKADDRRLHQLSVRIQNTA